MVRPRFRFSVGRDFFAPAHAVSQRVVVAVATLSMTVYSFFLATGRTWDPTMVNRVKQPNPFGADFLRLQALAILDGRLSVPASGYPWTECMIRDGKCFGYFGVFPSLLRFPEFVITGRSSINHLPVYVALGVGLCFWASFDLFRRVIAGTSASKGMSDVVANRALMLGALIIGPASVLTFLSEPAIYEETILWAAALTMVTVNMAWRWVHEQRLSHLVLALIAGIAATTSRPSAVPVMVALGGYLIFRSRNTSSWRTSWRARVLEVALMVVPGLAYAGVMFAKFGQVTPPVEKLSYFGDATSTELMRSNGGDLTGPRFVLTNLFQYLRPDSISLSRLHPWFRPTVNSQFDVFVIPPINQKGLWTDGVVSMTNTMFVQFVLTVTFVASEIKKVIRQRFVGIGLVLVGCSLLAASPMLMNYSSVTRYLGDFYPFLIVGSIFGLALLISTKAVDYAIKRIMLDIGISLALLSSFVWFVLQVSRW